MYLDSLIEELNDFSVHGFFLENGQRVVLEGSYLFVMQL